MKEFGRIKERYEFSFDSRQLGLVLFAAACIAALVFVLGMSVGTQLERKKAEGEQKTQVLAKAPPAKPGPVAPVVPAAPPVAPPPATAPSAAPAAVQTPPPPAAPEKAPEQNLTFPKVLTSNTKKTAPLTPEKKKAAAPKSYTVQVGAYNEKKAAAVRAQRLRDKGYEARVYTANQKKDRYAHKVRIGSFGSRSEAERAAKKFKSAEKATPYVTLEE